jgi:FixJ family two-component response regulator
MDDNDRKLVVTVVDDDASIRNAMSTLLRSVGWAASTYASAEDLLRANSPNGTDCLILDIELPGMNGLELQRQLARSEWRHVPIIFVTGRFDECAHTQAIQGGAFAFFAKPVEPETLLWAVRFAAQLVH